MDVILLQDIYKHGVAGQVVSVADGFARNYLIPRKMAVKASAGALKAHQKLTEQVEARRAAYENMLNELARQINGVELVFGRRAAATGKLFGSVTTQEVADALMEKTGVDINRRRISQQGLREVGRHVVPVRLGSEISPELNVVIVREELLADFLEAQARGDEMDPLTGNIRSVAAPAAQAAPSAEELEVAAAVAAAIEEANTPHVADIDADQAEAEDS